MFIVGLKEIPLLVPFSKNMYMSGFVISSSLIFVILSIASQLKPGALK